MLNDRIKMMFKKNLTADKINNQAKNQPSEAKLWFCQPVG